VECRGERDPDEPASAEVDEWHSRANPRHIILHMTNGNPANFNTAMKCVVRQ